MSSLENERNCNDKDYIVEKILSKRITDKGLEYFLKWKDLPDSQNAWKSVETLNCPELVKAYEDSLKSGCSKKKRQLSATKRVYHGFTVKKKVCVNKSKDSQMHIDLLPKEILTRIFKFLEQNELGSIGRVSRKWHELTRCPLLWKKVDVHFRWHRGSQNKVAAVFLDTLPNCLTHLKLDFLFLCFLKWTEHLKFQEFCMKLASKCPSLRTLIMHGTCFSVSLQSVIDLCSQYFQNLEVLSLHYSIFSEYCVEGEYSNFPKIKILDFFCNFRCSTKLTFPRMSSLKELSLVKDSKTTENWFQNDISFLDNLEVLNLQWSYIDSRIFRTLKNHAKNLTELYLCEANLKNEDFIFHSSVFPRLKIMCLNGCDVSCESLLSLIHSCCSLEAVYVDATLAASLLLDVFFNCINVDVVKRAGPCQHFVKDYLNRD